MARDFSTRTDTDKTELTKYPDGRIKDGITDGTKAGEEVVGDFQQVFLKAMRDAGITPNGLPDNEINGWQMFDACFGTAKVPITTFYNGVSGVKLGGSLITDPIRVWKSNGGKIVNIEGWIFNGSGLANGLDLFQIPAGYRPIKDIFIWAISTDANYESGSLLYNHTTGDVSLNVNISGNDGMYHYINASIPLD